MTEVIAEAAIRLVTSMRSSRRMPGRRGLARVNFICAMLSAFRAYSTTLRPARAATSASAVPHAPAPITLTVSYAAIGQLSR
jgi:hypothetical protein